MGINLGSTSIQDLRLGSNQVSKVYLGTELVWNVTPSTVRALKFECVGSQTLGINRSKLGSLSPNFEYSNDGQTWVTWDITTTLPFGNSTVLYLRGNNTFLALAGTNYVNFMFSTSSPVVCEGNIMHLFDYTQDLVDFPDESGTSRGIKYMFQGCTQLVTPPSLPAIGLTNNVYFYTFDGCSSLSSIPLLPASVLKPACYHYMFRNCPLIKMSETQSNEYPNIYSFGSIPGNVYGASMFSGTGGTFTGDPEQATYYTANTIIS